MKKLIIFLLTALSIAAFGQTTDVTLTTQAQQIKNETVAGANTANRVGTHLQNLVYAKKSFFADGTASGTDTYSVTLDNGAITVLTNQWLVIKFTNGNTGAATLNPNAIGAKALVKTDGTALSSGDIDAGSIHILAYDGTNLQVLTIGGSGGAGTPGGADTQVQINNAGAFGGDADFLFTGGNLLTVPLVKITSGSPGANKVLTSDADGDASWTTPTSVIGAQDLFITGPAMWRTVTAGCSDALSWEVGGKTYKTLDFDQTTDENAQFQFSLPRNWNNGTITVTAYWTASGSGSGTVQFEVSAVALSNDDPFSTSFGTAVAIDDTLIALDDVHISPTSSAITIGGTPADGDLILVNILRDVSDDTLTADARLLGIRITLTLDASTSE